MSGLWEMEISTCMQCRNQELFMLKKIGKLFLVNFGLHIEYLTFISSVFSKTILKGHC